MILIKKLLSFQKIEEFCSAFRHQEEPLGMHPVLYVGIPLVLDHAYLATKELVRLGWLVAA